MKSIIDQKWEKLIISRMKYKNKNFFEKSISRTLTNLLEQCISNPNLYICSTVT